MNYREWEQTVPDEIKEDSVWKCEAYRLSLFLCDLSWWDATKLVTDKRTVSLADQLFRAVGGISATIEEGYSRGTGRNRARFYEYALGSARESRGWYYKGRHVLGEKVSKHRLVLLTQIIRLLITMVPNQRGHVLREEPTNYRANFLDGELPPQHLDELFNQIPMPQ